MMMMARRTMRRMVGATAWPWAWATRSLNLSAINDNRIIMSPPLITLDLPEIWTPPNSRDCNPLPQRNCWKDLGCCELGKRCGWLPSTKYRESRHERKGTTVYSMYAKRSGVEIMGKNAVVIGRSNIVGLPTSLLLQPGAVVLDVGTCPVDVSVDPSCEYGYRLMGDVCYEEAMRLASVITPVPGGVGPMTVAMLLSNTLDSAKRAYGFT
ncbi:hypothetical protein CUMW_002130 [Citrus unshiu]|nr:hypothetical protein CUMW_002130 [Citrus unshiu]